MVDAGCRSTQGPSPVTLVKMVSNWVPIAHAWTSTNATPTTIARPQRCENTEGSFKCLCDEGYISQTSDGYNCEDVNECALASAPDCEFECENLPGSVHCIAATGYELNEDGLTLTILMNVKQRIASCDPLVSCTNTPGSRDLR